jgi:hypothetical protein
MKIEIVGDESETKHRFERHWQTQRVIDALAELEPGERISKDDLAARCDISVDSLDKRMQSAKNGALRDHNVIIMSIRGFGVERVPQNAADVPVGKYLNGARNKARRASNVFKHGITDWEKIPKDKRTLMFAQQAQLGVISHVANARGQRKIASAVANGRIDVGRTLELLKK